MSKHQSEQDNSQNQTIREEALAKERAHLTSTPIAEQAARVLASVIARSGKSKSGLSDELGMSSSYLSMVEGGKRALPRSKLLEIRELCDMPRADFDLLWSYASRGNGKEFDDVVRDDAIIGDLYKEDFVYSLCKKLSDPSVDLEPSYQDSENVLTLKLDGEFMGNYQREAVVTIQIKSTS